MAGWLIPALKAVLPHVGDILSAAKPVFARGVGAVARRSAVRRAGAMNLAPLALLLAASAVAQTAEPPNAILLVAKPGLEDPNFRQTVVLVTQAPDFSTVGVILNRPTQAKHEKTGEPVYFGGPVMREVLVALFRADSTPAAPAFPVLKGIYLSMHPEIIEPLLAGPGRYRLYAGFSGWAPRQLEGEIARDGWYVLPASAALVFRKDTAGMWQELVEKARGERTRGETATAVVMR